MGVPHFAIPLDLPHAGTIARRIERLLSEGTDAGGVSARGALNLVARLLELLEPYRLEGENPTEALARPIVAEAAALGRQLVDEIERRGIGFDRLGQCVRNLFECLELGEEGATISLRAGENPASAQRPV